MRVKLPTAAADPLPQTFSYHDTLMVSSADTEPSYTDDQDVVCWIAGAKDIYVYDVTSGGDFETRDLATDQTGINDAFGIAKIGDYVYAGGHDNSPVANYVIRYAYDDLAAGGTVMTVSGTAFGTTTPIERMITDGVSLWFNNEAGDTASSLHVFREYTISGTTLTSGSTVTCGATSANFADSVMDSDGNFFGMDSSEIIRRHDSSGTLQATLSNDIGGASNFAVSIEGTPYLTYGDATGNHVFRIKAPLQA